MDVRSQPDIVLIILDTLRADRLSCYGYGRETSPHIDAFADKGVLFERAISPAQWTIPAHGSLFTGEYPTTHMTHQIYDKHSKDQATMAELLQREGYRTVGFCNNPLLGVVENDLDRGFEEFYNYGGVFPERPDVSDSRPRRAGRALQHIIRRLNRLNGPIQEIFTHNDFLLGIMLHPLIAPFWQRYINFKGNTRQSLGDMVGYLRTRQRKGRDRKLGRGRPLFVFLNLMETHLPYGPPARLVRRFAPYYLKDREARDFMRGYNGETLKWIMPLIEPFSELQHRVLNDMYDAEVAYEDHQLHALLDYLDQPEVRDHTLVIIMADHGEGLDHHDYVGHSFVTYEDLVRVPLILRYPRVFPERQRVEKAVSTRRIFHTILETAGIFPATNSATEVDGAPVDVKALSLTRSLNGSDPENGIVFSEAYPPQTLLQLMEHQAPAAIDTFRCRFPRRAVYQGMDKLVTVGDAPDELFDMRRDPAELHNLLPDKPNLASDLDTLLQEAVAVAKSRRPANGHPNANVDLEADRDLAERLRGLGYIE
ncbi:MAG: sulfatase [Anaerolineae bacterium]|nr:sulfatase [Anaerolineae bacterium]